jgi:hypothetical protein
MLVIAICGAAGAGKSTAGKYVSERYGAEVFAFATPLKRLAKELFEFSDSQLYGTQAQKEATDPRYGFSPRQAFQRLNKLKAIFGSRIYADALVSSLRAAEARGCRVAVVDDLRFCDEAEALLEAYPDTVILSLDNPERESTADAAHPSETEWRRIHTPWRACFGKGQHAALYRWIDITLRSLRFREKTSEGLAQNHLSV